MVESHRQLMPYSTLLILAICAVGQVTEAHSEQVDMRILWKETNDKVDQLSNLVTKLMESMSEINRDTPRLSTRDKRQAIDSGFRIEDTGRNPFLDGLTLEDLRELVQCRDGLDGEPGVAGAAGAPGIPGVAGSPGEKGEQGEPGVNGTAGIPGVAGADGQDGMPGMTGAAGAPGMPGVVGQKGEHGHRGHRGWPGPGSLARSVYTRWGKKTCGRYATRLYEGFAAINKYHNTGGGNNFQCLPLNPQYDGVVVPSHGGYSYISGVEYHSFADAPLPRDAQDQNVPCSRCYATGSSTMMIPARRNCPVGWNREYHGYLMSEKSDHAHSSNYICIDATPDYVSGQGHDTNGGLLSFVVPICGNGWQSLGHCPPYQAGKHLLCTVCSK